MNFKTTGALIVGIAVCVFAGDRSAWGQTRQNDDLARSTQRAQQKQKYELKYGMQKGDRIQWQVEQIATTDTTMAGYREESSLRSRSVISWTILDVQKNGNIKIQDQLESAVEWQKVGDEEPVRYDSSSDEEVPDIYLSTADKIGRPISTTTIDAHGGIIHREDHIAKVEFGMGRLTLPLPAEPVAIGYQWDTREEFKTRRGDQTIKMVQTRMLYTLRKVENGIATISFRREVLTPIRDPKVKSQIQQKLNQGVMLFDLRRGLLTRKFVQWDEKIQGFEGDDSYLHYVGSYTMTLMEEETKTAGNRVVNPLKPRSSNPSARSSGYVRPRNGKPIIRK